MLVQEVEGHVPKPGPGRQGDQPVSHIQCAIVSGRGTANPIRRRGRDHGGESLGQLAADCSGRQSRFGSWAVIAEYRLFQASFSPPREEYSIFFASVEMAFASDYPVHGV